MLCRKTINRKEHKEKTRKELKEDILFVTFANNFAAFAVKKHIRNISK